MWGRNDEWFKHNSHIWHYQKKSKISIYLLPCLWYSYNSNFCSLMFEKIAWFSWREGSCSASICTHFQFTYEKSFFDVFKIIRIFQNENLYFGSHDSDLTSNSASSHTHSFWEYNRILLSLYCFLGTPGFNMWLPLRC